ncbi:hypothetical protein IMZ28_02480 [Sulfurovum indicum]|uniref:Outer membrane protein beta-barrel domain-containing protein n=2 Tax=Sulfurovaceae TaxID=2771472 RepID=A0A7M1S5L2_9BACT|nr:hypothetical protein IMZ28_02480 [Sulfurovum indicum]
MKMKKIIIGTLLMAGLLQADGIGLNINSEDVEVEGTINLNSIVGYSSGTNYFLGLDYLHTNDDNLFKVGFGASNTLKSAGGVTFSFGLESVIADSYFTLPLFGQAALRLPFDEEIPATSLKAKVAYAPSVLSFSDADNYLEYRLEADMEVISNIHIYGGYRNIDTDYETYNYNFNDSWYGGLKVSF